MTTIDVPCDGRATFHRLGVRALRDSLLADEAKCPSYLPTKATPLRADEIIATFLRPAAYVLRGLGT